MNAQGIELAASPPTTRPPPSCTGDVLRRRRRCRQHHQRSYGEQIGALWPTGARRRQPDAPRRADPGLRRQEPKRQSSRRPTSREISLAASYAQFLGLLKGTDGITLVASFQFCRGPPGGVCSARPPTSPTRTSCRWSRATSPASRSSLRRSTRSSDDHGVRPPAGPRSPDAVRSPPDHRLDRRRFLVLGRVTAALTAAAVACAKEDQAIPVSGEVASRRRCPSRRSPMRSTCARRRQSSTTPSSPTANCSRRMPCRREDADFVIFIVDQYQQQADRLGAATVAVGGQRLREARPVRD